MARAVGCEAGPAAAAAAHRTLAGGYKALYRSALTFAWPAGEAGLAPTAAFLAELQEAFIALRRRPRT